MTWVCLPCPEVFETLRRGGRRHCIADLVIFSVWSPVEQTWCSVLASWWTGGWLVHSRYVWWPAVMLRVVEAERSPCRHQTSTVLRRRNASIIFPMSEILLKNTDPPLWQSWQIQLRDSSGFTYFISICSLPPIISQEKLNMLQAEVGVSTPVYSCNRHDGTAFELHELNATSITVSSRQYYSAFDSYVSIQRVLGWWISITTTIQDWAQRGVNPLVKASALSFQICFIIAWFCVTKYELT